MQWKSPNKGWWKLNVDGAIFLDLCRAREGGVLRRDSQNWVVMATTQPELHHVDSLEMDFLAILRGLQHCVPMNLSCLMVEMDCLVQYKPEEGPESHANYRHIIQEILNLASTFELCSFHYVW